MFRFLKNTLQVKVVESRTPSKHMTGPIEKMKPVRTSVTFYLVSGRSLKLLLKPLLQLIAGDSFLKAQTFFHRTIRAVSGS